MPAVDRVSFSVDRGEIFGLIGPDGAGKTTIVQVLAGLLRVDGGHATVGGVDVLADPERVKRTIGYMPQGLGLNLYDSLTVRENIDFFRALRSIPDASFIENRDRLLAMTRLVPFVDRPAGKLSGGMRQKLALVCTLLHLPDLLLLDEPTTGVDPISRRDFWAIVHDLVRRRAVTVLLTTAYMDEAERCHRIVMMDRGRVIAAGTPADLLADLRGTLLAVRGEAPHRAAHVLAGWPEVESVALFGREVHALFAEGVADARARVRGAGLGDVDVCEIPPRLEDVFVRRLAGDAARTLGGVDVAPVVGARTTGEASIRVADLSCRFGPFTAVDRVSVSIAAGEVFGLLGPNGAGKTTLIKMLCGLQRPTAGTATVCGFDVGRAQSREALRGDLGYMSQRFSLYRDLTVRANLALYAGLYGLPRARASARIRSLLTALGLDEHRDRTAESLPLGLRQRLALAAALLHEPRVLFLDEPTSGVDPLARRQFWAVVHEVTRRAGMTVLVSTHYMDEAEHCDRLGLMHRGRLVAAAAPDDVKRQAVTRSGPVVVVQAPDFTAAFDVLRPRFPDAMFYGRRVQWQALDPSADIAVARGMLARAGVGADIAEQPPSIEDAFVDLIAHSESSDG